jgi:hypothetical protein
LFAFETSYKNVEGREVLFVHPAWGGMKFGVFYPRFIDMTVGNEGGKLK